MPTIEYAYLTDIGHTAFDHIRRINEMLAGETGARFYVEEHAHNTKASLSNHKFLYLDDVADTYYLEFNHITSRETAQSDYETFAAYCFLSKQTRIHAKIDGKLWFFCPGLLFCIDERVLLGFISEPDFITEPIRSLIP